MGKYPQLQKMIKAHIIQGMRGLFIALFLCFTNNAKASVTTLCYNAL